MATLEKVIEEHLKIVRSFEQGITRRDLKSGSLAEQFEHASDELSTEIKTSRSNVNKRKQKDNYVISELNNEEGLSGSIRNSPKGAFLRNTSVDEVNNLSSEIKRESLSALDEAERIRNEAKTEVQGLIASRDSLIERFETLSNDHGHLNRMMNTSKGDTRRSYRAALSQNVDDLNNINKALRRVQIDIYKRTESLGAASEVAKMLSNLHTATTADQATTAIQDLSKTAGEVKNMSGLKKLGVIALGVAGVAAVGAALFFSGGLAALPFGIAVSATQSAGVGAGLMGLAAGIFKTDKNRRLIRKVNRIIRKHKAMLAEPEKARKREARRERQEQRKQAREDRREQRKQARDALKAADTEAGVSSSLEETPDAGHRDTHGGTPPRSMTEMTEAPDANPNPTGGVELVSMLHKSSPTSMTEMTKNTANPDAEEKEVELKETPSSRGTITTSRESQAASPEVVRRSFQGGDRNASSHDSAQERKSTP